MKKGLIAAGGDFHLESAKSYLEGRSYDVVIGADAGLDILKQLHIPPDAVVGDFDTVSEATLRYFEALLGVEWEVHKPEKDETDMELALMTALKLGCAAVDIIGGTGGRMDHSLGNIQLLYSFFNQGIRACLIDRKNKIYIIDSKASKTFFQKQLYGKYISFIPFTGIVEGITLTGFKYPLTDKTIAAGTTLCISNELTGQEGSIEFRSGILICVESHD